MHRFLILVGATTGSWLGWTVGAYIGLFTSVILSSIGMGVGWIIALRFAREYGS